MRIRKNGNKVSEPRELSSTFRKAQQAGQTISNASLRRVPNPTEENTAKRYIDLLRTYYTPMRQLEFDHIMLHLDSSAEPDFTITERKRMDFLTSCANYLAADAIIGFLDDAASKGTTTVDTVDQLNSEFLKRVSGTGAGLIFHGLDGSGNLEEAYTALCAYVAANIKTTGTHESLGKALRHEFQDEPDPLLTAIAGAVAEQNPTAVPVEDFASVLDRTKTAVDVRPKKSERMSTDLHEETTQNAFETQAPDPALAFLEQEQIRERISRARLTATEHEVLELMLQGYSESEISESRKKAVGTVRKQMQDVKAKLKRAENLIE